MVAEPSHNPVSLFTSPPKKEGFCCCLLLVCTSSFKHLTHHPTFEILSIVTVLLHFLHTAVLLSLNSTVRVQR